MLKTRTRTRTRTKQTLPKKHQIIPAPKSNKKMQDKLKQYKKKGLNIMKAWIGRPHGL